MDHKISAIVLNYKHPKDTIACISALLKSDGGQGADYYIVDNSPEEKFEKEFKKTFPKVNYLCSPTNSGFAGGNNQAIREILSSDSQYILIINPDVRVGKRFFKPLLTDLINNKRAGIVAPAIKHQQKGETFFGLQGTVDWNTGKASHLNLRRLPTGMKTRAVQFVTFACVLIRAEVFRKAGLLDERYFMYLEDVDFCLSAGRTGFEVLIDPQVVVSHETSSSFAKPTDKLLISFRSQLTFINKWLAFPKNIFPTIYTLFFYPYLYLLWTYHFYMKKG